VVILSFEEQQQLEAGLDDGALRQGDADDGWDSLPQQQQQQGVLPHDIMVEQQRGEQHAGVVHDSMSNMRTLCGPHLQPAAAGEAHQVAPRLQKRGPKATGSFRLAAPIGLPQACTRTCMLPVNAPDPAVVLLLFTSALLTGATAASSPLKRKPSRELPAAQQQCKKMLLAAAAAAAAAAAEKDNKDDQQLTLHGDPAAAAQFWLGPGGVGAGRNPLIWHPQLDGLTVAATQLPGLVRSPTAMAQLLKFLQEGSMSDDPVQAHLLEDVAYSGFTHCLLAPYHGPGPLQLMAAYCAAARACSLALGRTSADAFSRRIGLVLAAVQAWYPHWNFPHAAAGGELLVHLHWRAWLADGRRLVQPLGFKVCKAVG
jgi:hypothetical protein